MIRQVTATLQKPYLLRITTQALASTTTSSRTLVTKAPGADPLEVLKKECLNRKLCDSSGYRMPGVHWVFSVAMAPSPELGTVTPNLRTVGIQRVSPLGVDFVMKRGCKTSNNLALEQPLAVLFSQGKYVPGEKAEQWRGEGHCEKIPLDHILQSVPHYTLTGMLVSKRIEKESLESGKDLHGDVSVDRLALMNKSHVTEVTQRTRLELENNQLSTEELEESIQAFRFVPDRLERLHGSPDSILWERWEWLRSSSGDCPEDAIPWNAPTNLLPH